jgi:CDP-diacylglycerol--glycerol-3-phosphate 3-phosphatidyltransferase
VLTRGFIVDGIRSMGYAEGMTAFGESNMMRSDLTRWLTAGRTMRTVFGYAKALGFVFLTGLEGYRHHDATDTFIGWLYDIELYRFAGWVCVWGAVALTVIRGLPVIYDAIGAWTTPQSPQPAAPEQDDPR